MELVQAEENRATEAGAAVARTGPPARWFAVFGYLFVAAPVTAACAGVLDGPWASGFAYAVLLLGVGFICRAVLPTRPMERVRAEEDRAAADADADSHHDIESPDKVMAWCGYFLVAAPMMGICAGLLDDPWAAGFAYAVLLLGVGFVYRAVFALPPRRMERVRVEEVRAAADADADSHHEVASPDKVMAWCGYLLVAAPMMGISAGLLDGPWAAGFAYAALLLGVASICRAVFALPSRRMERVQAHENRAVVDDAGHHHEDTSPNAAMAWCGYLLVATPVTGACAGLADTPGAALFGYALLLLGFAFIGLAMLPLRPMERMLEDENRPVGNVNRRGNEAVVHGAGTMAMDWTGYFVVATPVVASWAGLVEGPAATFFAFALLLLGITFIIMAMYAVAKPKMA